MAKMLCDQLLEAYVRELELRIKELEKELKELKIKQGWKAKVIRK